MFSYFKVFQNPQFQKPQFQKPLVRTDIIHTFFFPHRCETLKPTNLVNGVTC